MKNVLSALKHSKIFAKLLRKKIGFNHFVNDSIVLHEFPFNEEEKRRKGQKKKSLERRTKSNLGGQILMVVSAGIFPVRSMDGK